MQFCPMKAPWRTPMESKYGKCVHCVPWQISSIFLDLEIQGLMIVIIVQGNCYAAMALLAIEER